MKTALLTLVLLFTTCNSAPKDARWKHETPKSNKGEVLFIAPFHEGWKTLAVTLLPTGRVEVFINPAEVYQDADDSGRSFLGNLKLNTRWVEVVRGQPPGNAMQARGWRDPWVRFRCRLQIFPGAGLPLRIPAGDGLPAELRIFQCSENGFLVVISTVEPIYEVMPAVEAGGGDR